MPQFMDAVDAGIQAEADRQDAREAEVKAAEEKARQEEEEKRMRRMRSAEERQLEEERRRREAREAKEAEERAKKEAEEQRRLEEKAEAERRRNEEREAARRKLEEERKAREEERERNRKENAAATFSTSMTEGAHRWEFSVKDGFKPFDNLAQKTVEAKYQKWKNGTGTAQCSISSQGKNILIDFVGMTQQIEGSNRSRKIRRRETTSPHASPGPSPAASREASPAPSLQGDAQHGTLQVVIPPGVGPGQKLMVDCPNGKRMQVTVPAGLGPGQALQFRY
jgi:hypothetical protein